MRYRIIMEVQSIDSLNSEMVRVALASPLASKDSGRSRLSMVWASDTAPQVGAKFEVSIEAQ